MYPGGRGFAACEDTSNQTISIGPGRVFDVEEADCVACNLCVNVCPVADCITIERLPVGAVDPRTGSVVRAGNHDWTTHPNNPASVAAE